MPEKVFVIKRNFKRLDKMPGSHRGLSRHTFNSQAADLGPLLVDNNQIAGGPPGGGHLYNQMMRYYPDTSRDSAYFVNNYMFRNDGYQFLCDANMLRAALTSVGFTEIIQLGPDEGPDENLRGIDVHERLIGQDMGKIETMVFEATRPA